MYHLLECYGPDDRDRAGILYRPQSGAHWDRGRRFDTPPQTPLQVDINPDFPGIMLPMFHTGILLMTGELVKALRECGVNNIDTYDALIRDVENNQRYDEYKAVNIIGLVACADLSASDYVALSGSALIDVDFDSLVIDAVRAHGLLMFRLAESVNGIVVHEKVKNHLERKGFPHLDFVRPEDWLS